MFNLNTCTPAVKIVTTTYPDDSSSSLDLMKPGVSLALDMLQLIKDRTPETSWPAYFDIDGISKWLQKYREGELFAREGQALMLLDDAVHEMVSVFALAEFNRRAEIAEGGAQGDDLKFTDDELARFDHAVGLVKMLSLTGDTEGVLGGSPEGVFHEALRLLNRLHTVHDLFAAMRCTPLTDPETRH